jgi:hypothetical protein
MRGPEGRLIALSKKLVDSVSLESQSFTLIRCWYISNLLRSGWVDPHNFVWRFLPVHATANATQSTRLNAFV